jgi:16S rRNA (guanine1207-N2)-methyltransferase
MRLLYCAPSEITALGAEDLAVDFDVSRLRQLRAEKARCAELMDVTGRFEQVEFFVHRAVPRAQTEFELGYSRRLLAPDGPLRVTMPQQPGIERWRRTLSRFYAVVERLRTTGSVVTFECRYPKPSQESSLPPSLKWFAHDGVSDRRLEFETRPGLFSYRRIDPATQLLLDEVGALAAARVLDVGCGYGAIGITIACRGADVTMVDSDIRAVKNARKNLDRNGLGGTVLLNDGCDELQSESFDMVLSNPPTHAGSAALRALFIGMMRVCRGGGSIWIVVRKHLHYEKWLKNLGLCQCTAANERYKLIRISRPDKDG